MAREAGKLEDLAFLLNVLREIDSPKVIHALTKTLADTGRYWAAFQQELPRRAGCATLPLTLWSGAWT